MLPRNCIMVDCKSKEINTGWKKHYALSIEFGKCVVFLQGFSYPPVEYVAFNSVYEPNIEYLIYNILSTELRKWCENSSRPILTNAQGSNSGRLSFKWFRHSFSMHFSNACALVVKAVYAVSINPLHPIPLFALKPIKPYHISTLNTIYVDKEPVQFFLEYLKMPDSFMLHFDR